MVISTRTKGSRPCTDSKRRKSLCRYFSLQHWCTVDAVSYGKTSHVVFARTKKSAADCTGFSRLVLSGLAPLFSPEERQQKRPVVFIDVRGAKKWGLAHWFKHVTHLWSVSLFLMLFVTILMVLISNNFWFFLLFLFVWHNILVIIGTGVYSCHCLSTEDSKVWASERHGLADCPRQTFLERRTPQVEWNLRFGSEQLQFGSY